MRSGGFEMSPKPEAALYYWDACVFLSYVNGIEDRCSHIRPMLQEASNKQIRIVTSVMSVTEVAYGKIEQDGKELDASTEKLIDGLWRFPVNLVEYHRLIATDARALMRQTLLQGTSGDRWTLTPIDAIHLATARRIRADEFHTYDAKLKKFESITGLRIKEPETAQLQLPGS